MSGRHTSRTVLLAAVLGLAVTGVAACGSDDSATVTAEAPVAATATATPAETTAAPATPSTPPSETPAGTDAPIVVKTPAQNATVTRTFTVTGTSQTGEATVLWQLVKGGEAVAEGFAEGGAPGEPAPFSIRITAPAAGTYTVKVYEESAADGSAKNAVERTVTVG